MIGIQQADTGQILGQFKAFAANGASSAPTWLIGKRQDAIRRFAELGFPTMKQEKWRFTSVKPITEHAFTLSTDTNTLAPEQLDRFFLPIEGGIRLVFVNGAFVERLSSIPDVAEGVVIRPLSVALDEHGELVQQHLGKYAGIDDNPFAALNTAFATEGLFAHVPADTKVDHPLEIVYFTTGGDEPIMSHPRNLVVLERGASIRLIETYCGVSGRPYLTNAVTEIAVADNARADCYRIQREGDQAFHVATTHSRQARDSMYSLTPIVFGAALSRHDIWMALDGEGGEGTLNGLYLADEQQHVDHNTVIEHAVSHCDSHEYFNGILAGQARAVFNGLIIVRPGAQKTDSKQTNNNLLLSENARADSQPQLEIYADDVRCTHGATLGPLDDNALFYLRSRGVSAENARSLLTYGFGVEILNRVKIPEVKEQIDSLVKARLADAERGRGRA